jgi:XRE family aerobic/anaerobic benzoate catabolism transcriptional regulator
MLTEKTSGSTGDQTRDSGLLRELGDMVRTLRARRGMTRRELSGESQVSERYLAQLEQGQGNISIALLERVADALETSIGALLSGPDGQSAQETLILEALRTMDQEKQKAVLQMIYDQFAASTGPRQRIALMGLRGAGKTTLGKMLSDRIGLPFIRLSAEVETLAGMSVSEIFSLSGQPGYRRLEEQAMMDTLKSYNRCIIETGGSIGTDEVLLNTLLSSCFVIWVKADPEIYMQRVMKQGDLRPMKNNNDALSDLRRILSERDPKYRRAHAIIDTSTLDLDASLEAILEAIPKETVKQTAEE